jgi:hypothetical protein
MRLHQELFAGILALVVPQMLAFDVWASSIAQVEATASGTLATLDNASGQYPVISNMLSQPGTVNGVTYTTWTYMVDDGTGSAFVLGNPNGTAGKYTGTETPPVVGDTVTVFSKYSPSRMIPEVVAPGGTPPVDMVVNHIGGPAAVPAPTLATIPEINVPTFPLNRAGHMLELDGVTISGGISGTFGSANWAAADMITDGSGNSMQVYYFPSAYSVQNANLFGKTIQTGGPVNMTGFVQLFGTTSQFVPMTITGGAVPEPGTLALAMIAAVVLCVRRHAAN